MLPSFIHLIAHSILCVLLFAFIFRSKVRPLWAVFFSVLFLISPLAVFFIWGPHRLYWAYFSSGLTAYFVSQAAHRFNLFLETQEKIVKILSYLAWGILFLAVLLMSVSELNLRRETLVFWQHEVKIHPTAQNYLSLGDQLYFKKDYQKAKETYGLALKKDSHSRGALESLARLTGELGLWTESLQYWKQFILLKPDSQEAYLGLGKAYGALGENSQEIETYTSLLKRNPDDEDLYVKVIEAYGQAIARHAQEIVYQEKREEVLADFEQLSKRKKYSAADFFNLGFLYEQVGGKEEAIRFYTKAVQIQANYKEALYNLAKLYLDQGNYKVALNIYERLVHFYPRYTQAYLDMGILYNALGEQEKARQLYLKTVEIDENNAKAYFNLGYLNEAQGNLKEAINDYEKAIDAEPKNAETYYNLGNVYANLGQNAEAIALYLKTVAIDSKHQNAYVNLSILSFKSKDFKGAIQYLESAQKLGYNAPQEYLKTLELYRKK